jgi:hypothetical protein
MEAEVPHMNEPRKTPLVNINLPAKTDSVTLFRPEDHWALRLAVHAFRSLENIVTKVLVSLGTVAIMWHYWAS